MATTVAQRRRAKGWRKPEGSVCVDRTSRWGNPFTVDAAIRFGYADEATARSVCVHAFADWVRGSNMGWLCYELGTVAMSDRRRAELLDHVHQLRGKTLLCWCPQPGPCHAHVLAELADRAR